MPRLTAFSWENEAVHSGRLWGMPGRIAGCRVAALAQDLSGLTMWMYRKKLIASATSSR